MSKLIVISGVDGSGKSTQIKIISENLKHLDKTFMYLWTRGGYTPCFQYLKNFIRLVLGRKFLPTGYSKRRKEIIENNFISNLWINLAIIDLIIYWCLYLRIKMIFVDVILCDRYFLDTLIDFEINFPAIKIKKNMFWHFLIKFLPTPDLSLMLEIPFNESQNRLLNKFEPYPDNQVIANHRYSLYKKYLLNFNYKIIDANKGIKKVSANINKIINKVIFDY